MGYLDNSGLSYFWGLIKARFVKGNVGHFYGTCSTTASTQAKVVVCPEFSASDLVAGAMLTVKFTNAQTYNGAPTLNVNSTGAVSVKVYGTTNLPRYWWYNGEVVGFVYDGTNWLALNGIYASTTYYGMVRLVDSVTSTNTSGYAATPNSVKTAYDLANGKQDALVSGTNIKTVNGESLLGSGDIETPDATTTTIYEDAYWTVNRTGRTVMVQMHGATATAGSNTALLNVLSDYKPSYNASTTVADASGSAHFARLWVSKDDGKVYLAAAGYTTSATWYGTLTYIY